MKISEFLKICTRDFSGGPVVKNLPWDVGNAGLIPGLRTKIPHAVEQLSLHTATVGAHTPQQKIPHDAAKIPHARTETWCSQMYIYIHKICMKEEH